MHYMVGEVVESVVTGIKSYSAFIYLGSKHNRPIHISEISEHFARDAHTYAKVDERVEAKILDVDEDGMHFKLLLKAIEANKTRSMRKRRFVHELSQMNIGFTSLAEHLGQWAEEATK